MRENKEIIAFNLFIYIETQENLCLFGVSSFHQEEETKTEGITAV